MKEKIYQWTIPILALIVLVGLVIFEQSRNNESLGFFPDAFRNPSAITKVTVAPALTGYQGDGRATASSTLILSANDERSYARCTNISGVFGGIGASGIPLSVVLGANATLGYGATSTDNYGILLTPIASSSPNSFFEINKDNQFTGAIYASALATTTISCVQN